MNIEVFYDNIEAERARRGWTIRELATKLDINEKTYRNYRDTEKDIPASVVVKIANLFEVSADYLLGLSDKIGRES